MRVTEGGAPKTGNIQRQAQGGISGRGHSHRSLEILSSDQGMFYVPVEQIPERYGMIRHRPGSRKVLQCLLCRMDGNVTGLSSLKS